MLPLLYISHSQYSQLTCLFHQHRTFIVSYSLFEEETCFDVIGLFSLKCCKSSAWICENDRPLVSGMMIYMTISPASELIEYIRKLRYTPKLEATTWYIFMQIRHVIVSVRVVIPGTKDQITFGRIRLYIVAQIIAYLLLF